MRLHPGVAAALLAAVLPAALAAQPPLEPSVQPAGRLALRADGLEVIDLGDATLLPGLVDVHSHPLIAGDDYQVNHLRDSSAFKALRGLKAVQDNLRAGWTTLRIAATPTSSMPTSTSAARSIRGSSWDRA